jgi:hypothetical protein
MDEIVFAVRKPHTNLQSHWYENISYYVQGPGTKVVAGGPGRLCKLTSATGQIINLVNDANGAIRDPCVSYDAKKILFSYRKGGTDNYNLYEINSDGTGIKQLTSGLWDDIEAIYLPDGGIMFCSSRCKRWVPCWYAQVPILFRCNGDGTGIRCISSNVETENTPWMLPDGRIVYTRWEYVDRSRVHFHHLWSTYPNGTGHMVLYGNSYPSGGVWPNTNTIFTTPGGTLFIDAKPIPGIDPLKIIMIQIPDHGTSAEHAGNLSILRTDLGPDAPPSQAITTLSAAGGNCRDPYPLSKDSILVAKNNQVVLLDGAGNTVKTLYTNTIDNVWVHEPRPITPRPRENVPMEQFNVNDSTGKVLLLDVTIGRNMAGVKQGEIKKLLVLEQLPKPVNYDGSQNCISIGGTYLVNRVIGTVPVESDGSAYMELPAMRSLFFVALDSNDLSVKRMQSFFTLMPGENASCIGCHEDRTMAAPPLTARLASKRPASKPVTVPGTPQVFDFPRDIQPILDKYCLTCHNVDQRKGGVMLAGDQGCIFSLSFYELAARLMMADGRDLARGEWPPRQIGSCVSPLLKTIDGSHYNVALSSQEIRTIKLWIDASANFSGTYAALGGGQIDGYSTQYGTIPLGNFGSWPSVMAAQAALNNKCASCHTGNLDLPGGGSTGTFIEDDQGLKFHHMAYGGAGECFWTPPWVKNYGDGSLRIGTNDWMKKYADSRMMLGRHRIINLTRPEKSVMLMAPLAKSAGGYGICGTDGIFKGATDADYLTLLKALQEVKTYLYDPNRCGRFCLPNFKPRPEYVREMKRFCVLPQSFDVNSTPLNVYTTDEKYWRSLYNPFFSECGATGTVGTIDQSYHVPGR